MTYAGKLSQTDLIDHVMPAYTNFEDMSYDVTRAKIILKDFIVKHCKCSSVPNPSKNVDKYRMKICAIDGLSMHTSDNESLKYIFCVKTGKVYVGEMKNMALLLYSHIPFAFLISLYQDTESHTYSQVVILQ